MWVIRLPNLLSFPLFFYAVYKLSGYLKYNYLRYSFLLGMTCIPYILEYFSIARGYGMSMALLLFALYHFIGILQEYKPLKMLLIAGSLVLAVYANLNLIILLLLIFGYIGLSLLIEAQKNKSYRNFWNFLLLSFISAIALSYAIIFSFWLKEEGALYYGNKDGLWKTTGSTLSDLILQSTSIFIKYVFIVLLIGICVFIIRSFQKKIVDFWKSPVFIFSGLLLVSLLAIEAMRWLLNMNYPEDRVGMQLIFLFIGSLTFILNEIKSISYLGILFIFLPIVGYQHFNFDTSAFNPNERMMEKDFLLFNELQQGNVSSSTYTMLTYAYMVRKHNPTDFIIPEQVQWDNLVLGKFNEEIISTQEERDFNYPDKGYKVLRYNPKTREKILKREEEYQWKKVDSLSRVIPFVETSEIYQNIIAKDWEIPATKRFKAVLRTDVYTPQLAREALVIVVDKEDKEYGQVYEYFTLNWAAGKNREYSFQKVIELEPNRTESLGFYFWNPNEFEYQLKNLQLEIYVVE